MNDFARRWRTLADTGLFDSLSGLEGLEAGCARLESLAYDADDLGIFVSIISGCGLAIPILEAAGNRGDQIARVIRGDSVVAVAITEPCAGSDVLGMQTRLEGAVLTGHKWCITNAPVADAFIVFCQRGPALCAVLVPADAPRLRRSGPLSLAGAEGSPTGEVWFDGVEVEAGWILGAPEDGKALLDLAFVRERVLAPWPLIGKMSRVLQDGLDYVEQREQFGRPIKRFQYVQDKIVAGYEALEATRLLATEALARLVSGQPAHLHASLAKYHAADSAVSTFRAMVELFGSYGLRTEAGLVAYVAGAMCAAIAGGTRGIHKKVVFDQLVLDRARARRSGRSKMFTTTHEERTDHAG